MKLAGRAVDADELLHPGKPGRRVPGRDAVQEVAKILNVQGGGRIGRGDDRVSLSTEPDADIKAPSHRLSHPESRSRSATRHVS